MRNKKHSTKWLLSVCVSALGLMFVVMLFFHIMVLRLNKIMESEEVLNSNFSTEVHQEVEVTPEAVVEIPVDMVIETKDDIAECVMYYSAMYDVDPVLVMAVIKVESDFIIDAYNNGCVGLMQTSEGNIEWYNENTGVTDLYDPQQNIHAGIFHLSYVLEQYDGNVNMALMAYNMGGLRAYNLFWQDGIYECEYTERVFNAL
jgi:Soluble lytic murein transglycosylase and related regulatory proteins (some contain LysM/invasin domains)